MPLNQLHLSVRWQNLGVRYLTLRYLSKVSDSHHCLNGFFVNIPCLKTKYSREKSYLKYHFSLLVFVLCLEIKNSHFHSQCWYFQKCARKRNYNINQTPYIIIIIKASTLIFWNKKATDLFKVSTSNEEISKWVPQLT